MIPARPSPMLRWYFGRHVESRFKHAFAALRIRGLDAFRRSTAAGPVLVVSNHTSWWDPMFCIWLSTRLARVDGYAMMDSKNLRALPFLGRLGGFGVDPGSPLDGYRAVRYAAQPRAAGPRLERVLGRRRCRSPIAADLLRIRPHAADVLQYRRPHRTARPNRCCRGQSRWRGPRSRGPPRGNGRTVSDDVFAIQ